MKLMTVLCLLAAIVGPVRLGASELLLTEESAETLSKLALHCIHQDYPNKPGHVLQSEADILAPSVYHPAFYGCFDWHSAVHGHWMLVRILREYPDIAIAEEIREKLDQSLTEDNLLKELSYFETPGRKSFERMYGWAWYLKLTAEVVAFDDPQARKWQMALEPLAEFLTALYQDFLPKQVYPIRRGVHPNTAFGLAFAHDYAVVTKNSEFQAFLTKYALKYFEADKNYPAAFEQGGDNFFSPCLMEADLMRRVMPQPEFQAWLAEFLPGIESKQPENLFYPAVVSDRTDGFIVHLDGLNLSRAWCMAGIANALPGNDPRRSILIETAKTHALTALPELNSGHYEGEHWLGSFAIQMLSEFSKLESTD